MRRNFFTLVLFGTVCVTASLHAAETYKYADLVGRLTDLERLAEKPVPGEISGQHTSYDRASKYDSAAGQYIAWDANGDGGGVIERYADGSVLMADIKGPGVINRIWSALAEKGHVKIFIDGSETPTVDLPFEDYFSGKIAPFNRSALVYKTTANGFNNWTPIPFKKSCRIIGLKDWGAYYYFQFIQFPEGTQVPTFSMNLDAAANAALDKAQEKLAHCGPLYKANTPPKTIAPLAAGAKMTLTLPNKHAIRGGCVKVVVPEDGVARRDLLRSVTISIYWDNEKEPAVWAPIGDFFGTATERADCLSYPTGLTEDGFYYTNWFMPYEKAKIVITNEGKEPVRFERLEFSTIPLKKAPSEYLRFHAKWHRNSFPPKEPERAAIDWSLLETEGIGKFVGVSLHIENFRGDWWGEGDEKFFLDGEKFPSYFGTGSEDYFGYAWSSANRFVQAFHAQPTNKNNRYYIVNNRWHVTDVVLFRKSFSGYIEKYFKDERPCLYAATAFWYLSKSGVDPYKPVPLADRIGYYVDTTVQMQLPKGGVAYRDLIPKERAENLSTQGMSGFGVDWYDDEQLWWRPSGDGKTVTLRLPAPEEGKYTLSGRFTHANDYGKIQLIVNGKDVGAPIDLYNADRVIPVDHEIGVAELKKGENELVLKVVGKNEESRGYLAGINYLVLVPVE
jgi:hypothetical protein